MILTTSLVVYELFGIAASSRNRNTENVKGRNQLSVVVIQSFRVRHIIFSARV